MVSERYFAENHNLLNIFRTLKYRWQHRKEHPYEFTQEGITIFTGAQGEGKTLSAVNMAKHILADYPQAVFCSNIAVKGIQNAHAEFTGIECLEQLNNGENGVVFLIDEIQNYLNSLLSKNVPISTIVELTQQRKQKKLIIATSQVYSRMAKPLREQVRNVVICRNFLNLVQVNDLIDSLSTSEKADGTLHYHKVKRFIWFHAPFMYNQYDTYQKVYGLAKPDNTNIVYLANADDLTKIS